MTTVSLNGCSTTAGVEATGKTVWNDEGARELSKKVVFNSSSLAGDLQVVDMQSALAGNMMRAQATLKSKDKDTLEFPVPFRLVRCKRHGDQFGRRFMEAVDYYRA